MTPYSWKIVTTANCSFAMPFECPPVGIWNDALTAKTATIEGIWGGGALPNDDEVWIDVEYLGSGSSPQASFVSDSKADMLATAAAQAASGATWGGGLSSLATWNPADRSGVTLTNGNLTATVPSDGGVRGIGGKSSGKYYLEYIYTTISTNSFNTGISLLTGSLTSPTTGVAFTTRSSGNIFVNNLYSGSTLGLISSGAVVGVAVDLTAQLIWFRVAPAGNWNGSGTANPATGAGGVSISSISSGSLYPYMSGDTGDAVTANFGATAFSGAVPSGFTAGWPVGAALAFSLSTTFTPAQAGFIYCRVKCAKPSATFYIDPMVVLT